MAYIQGEGRGKHYAVTEDVSANNRLIPHSHNRTRGSRSLSLLIGRKPSGESCAGVTPRPLTLNTLPIVSLMRVRYSTAAQEDAHVAIARRS